MWGLCAQKCVSWIRIFEGFWYFVNRLCKCVRFVLCELNPYIWRILIFRCLSNDCKYKVAVVFPWLQMLLTLCFVIFWMLQDKLFSNYQHCFLKENIQSKATCYYQGYGVYLLFISTKKVVRVDLIISIVIALKVNLITFPTILQAKFCKLK